MVIRKAIVMMRGTAMMVAVMTLNIMVLLRMKSTTMMTTMKTAKHYDYNMSTIKM